MSFVVKVVLAVYNFFAGDIVILLGVTTTMVILALIDKVAALEPIRPGMGAVLIVGVLVTLVLSEARSPLTLKQEWFHPGGRGAPRCPG